jgi:hypothetical protein
MGANEFCERPRDNPGVAPVLPLLFLDVDGVLNPFAAAACPAGYTEHDIFPGEEPVRLCDEHGRWLRLLSAAYDPAEGLTLAITERCLAWAQSRTS